MQRLSRILRERGLVTDSDLDLAERASQASRRSIGAVLVQMGALAEADLLNVAAEVTGLSILDDQALPLDQQVTAAIEKLGVKAASFADETLLVWEDRDGLSAAGPFIFDPAVQEQIAHWPLPVVRLYLVRSDVANRILSSFREDAASEAALTENAANLRELATRAPVVHFVNSLLTDAFASRASDAHIETWGGKIHVRLRIDGVLRPWRAGVEAGYDAVASRLKLLSGIDIAERRLPQDGRQRVRVSGADIDLRVSTLPTKWGESVVVRFLGNTGELPTFAGLGMADDHARLIRDVIDRPNGLILLTGPTGSGKTTTVYRMLVQLNDGFRKIVTAEDPIEMDLPGVTQMQVHPDIGLTFASGLRAMLRQDPDIIFVGEIRDSETARMAVQAALTGHLVISTAHTNSALAAVWRMLDLGIEPYLLAEVLRATVGQRLLKRLCESCKAPTTLSGADTELLPPDVAAAIMSSTWKKAIGCGHCGGTGFKGRLGAFEVAAITPALQAAIRAREPELHLERLARESGFRTIFDDAALKGAEGLTTVEDVLRVRR